MQMQRGLRCKLESYFDISKELKISIDVVGNAVYDSCCFGVDKLNKLSDDRYMVFYNQTSSPNREIVLNGSGSNTSYDLFLSKLPSTIDKLVFTLSIDGNGNMSQIKTFNVKVFQSGQSLDLSMSGVDFKNEKAVIALEIYKRDGWKLGVVASGFDGGLSDLLKHYGGVEETNPVSYIPSQEKSYMFSQTKNQTYSHTDINGQTYSKEQSNFNINNQPSPMNLSQMTNKKPFNMTSSNENKQGAMNLSNMVNKKPDFINSQNDGINSYYNDISNRTNSINTQNPYINSNKISLEKRLEKEAPQLISLAKPLRVSLEKNNLLGVVVQVALLIDISGSMTNIFERGTVQNVINKMVPLAMEFDDNGEFELWYFGSRTKRKEAVKISNYMQATDNWKIIMNDCGYGTELYPAMKQVIEEYESSDIPAYVLCITDGATSNERKVEELVIKSSKLPIFWQFVGLSQESQSLFGFFGGSGNSNFGLLEKLDNLRGRTVDNANFFSLNDIDRVDNEELYSRMLAEFPIWLKEAKRLGILH